VYRHIAVPVDDTVEGRQAIDFALRLGMAADAAIELVHVELDHAHDEALHRLRDRASESGLPVRLTLLPGHAPEALADYLATAEGDLVVMATHDRGRLERILLGSVTAHVIRRANQPILVLRVKDAGIEVSAAIRHIVVALDGSDMSDQILPHAGDLATLTGARVTLLTVVTPILVTVANAALGEPVLGLGAAISALPGEEQSVASEREWLARRADALRERGLRATTDVVLHQHAGRAIVEYAATHGADVIALSTHGRSALKRLVMGSVANHLLHSSDAMLLVVRPTGPFSEDAETAN
jgi:nucleotide-binding universal stress UspA family protein